jgi:hypothetical protein
MTMGEEENLQSLVSELETELQTRGWTFFEIISVTFELFQQMKTLYWRQKLEPFSEN